MAKGLPYGMVHSTETVLWKLMLGRDLIAHKQVNAVADNTTGDVVVSVPTRRITLFNIAKNFGGIAILPLQARFRSTEISWGPRLQSQFQLAPYVDH